jgi:flagellum-specific peptidoglycan hydrolase FlgJ
MNQYPKIFGLLLLLFISVTAPAQKSIKKYINEYESLALEKAGQYGIPASIILGVSIVESAAGQSLICKALNNFFGIKGKNWSSQKRMGYKSAYKEYKTDEESFDHFCQVLAKKKYYPKLKGTFDFNRWLKAMDEASYASAKQKWIDDITKTIKKFELQKLDDEKTGDTAGAKK